MTKMEEVVGSDGGLVKKKNSSGCLIIKKKKEENSRSVKVFEPNSNKKKRPCLVLSDSESSEDSLGQFNNKIIENNNLLAGENDSERKRGLDVFEFDEYDNIDENRWKKERNFENGSSKHTSEKRRQFDKMGKKEVADNIVKKRVSVEDNDYINEKRMKKERDFERSSGKNASVEKRKLFDETKNVKSRSNVEENDDINEKMMKKERDFGRLCSKHVIVEKGKLIDETKNVKSKSKIEDDGDGDLPLSSLREKLNSPPKKPIRVQGKNGVLKVTVTEKKKMEVPRTLENGKLKVEDEKGSKSEENTKKNKLVSFSSDSKAKMEKGEATVGKEIILKDCSSSRKVKREKDKSSGNITPVKKSASEIKRGSSTEKQKVREKLQKILLDAGWKIDYRPRKGRDYLDAVYISPTGTSYWSIPKAYDAFQKQMEDDVEKEPSSLSDDISLLTRNTQRKIERDMKMKRKENNKKRKFKEGSDEDSDSGEDEDEKPMKRKNKVNDDKKDRKFGRCTLLVRSSEKGINSENKDFVAYMGKRTLISWLIDSGVVSSGEKIKYMNSKKTKVMLEGRLTKSGIHCNCCTKIVSVAKFEIHAGSKLRQPYKNIYLESGVSLLQCQIEAWNKQEGSDNNGFNNVDINGDDPNDDTCSLCGDGGDLICCDSCPSTFHQSCLDIEMLPPGDWHCPNCTCKFCKLATVADEDDTAANKMPTCGICEKKYHESCCKKVDDSSNPSHSSASFCGSKCHKIFDNLQKILGVKHKLEGGFSWSLIHRSDVESDESDRSYQKRVVSNAKLAVALSVMDECFLPVVDRRSGINLVKSIIYNCGSNFSRLDYSGFYTIILERGDEIVAAASIRIRGTQLAEMPFIGTRHMYRRQGMCRRLLGAIESVLGSLKVKKLTIPAIAEHMHTWTAIFGFKPFDLSHKRELMSINMVVFPGVDMLQKFIVKKKTSEADISGKDSILSEENLTPDMEKESNADASDGHDINKSINGSFLQNDDQMNEKLGIVEPNLPDSVVPLNESNLPDDNHNLTPYVGKESEVDASDGHDINKSVNNATLQNGDEMHEKLDVVEPSLPDSVVPLNENDIAEMITNGEDTVSPSCSKTVSNQLDLNKLDSTEIKLGEAVKIGDSVILPDSKADIANNSNENVSKIAFYVNVPDQENGEAEDKANHFDLPTKKDNLKDKECIHVVESETLPEIKGVNGNVEIVSISEIRMAKEGNKENSPIGLNSTSAEGTVEEVKENIID